MPDANATKSADLPAAMSKTAYGILQNRLKFLRTDPRQRQPY
jgi:hypothetical protein